MLEVSNVDYSYRTRAEIKVLNNIEMKFEAGKIYAILGVSGSGKTTLLSLLAGLDKPTCGAIYYKGKDLEQIGLNAYRRKYVSLVFQNYNLIDYLTPKENVMLGGEKDPKIILENVGLTEQEQNRNVLQLSGGQQQRVAIARALASEAEILLADEPTGNLDEATAAGIIELLKRSAHDMGKCVIVVTHSSELAGNADIVKWIEGGKILDVKKN